MFYGVKGVCHQVKTGKMKRMTQKPKKKKTEATRSKHWFIEYFSKFICNNSVKLNFVSFAELSSFLHMNKKGS